MRVVQAIGSEYEANVRARLGNRGVLNRLPLLAWAIQ